MALFLGIDFSGGARPWRRSNSNPTVWLASAKDSDDGLQLVDLIPVQSLPGDQAPFDRMVNLLAAGEFEAAAIDAPFSLPSAHLPPGGHTELLRQISTLTDGHDRPFPLGASIVTLGSALMPLVEPKPLRKTEADWASKGVNTRSTMWNGPRGGAPFAAACLRLIERSGRPCWPWTQFQRGILVEAFPAAQLRQWGLPHQGYSGPLNVTVRKLILEALNERIRVSSSHRQILAQNTDALDAVIAVFAGVAVANGNVAGFSRPYSDGFIAVAE
jgi:uncharacterized protein DUF429